MSVPANSNCPASHDEIHPDPAGRPHNFSWLVPGVLSASAFPNNIENLQFLISNNVTCLVSLTAERTVDRTYIPEDQLKLVYLPIRDYTAPSIQQVQEFIQCVLEIQANKQAICVHCAHGLGRTGTMLSCYFVQTNNVTAEDAIAHVRNLRPGSVETTEQELLVHQFYEYNQGKMKENLIDRHS
uniref:Dual specificity protein phosphatase 23 n=1 Tax=Arion vulgaris TaxID=1028688 RepID=A0A0B6ZIU2_9EUPU